jgi:hypothetical protein
MEVGPIYYRRHVQSCLHDLFSPGVLLWIGRRSECNVVDVSRPNRAARRIGNTEQIDNMGPIIARASPIPKAIALVAG